MENLIAFLALIIAITIHEFSHAFVADYLGDPTPRSHGRLSLNPLKHLDLLGTLMLFVAHFGWGKPVPIDPYNLRHPKRDEMLISLAGPVSNLLLALLLSLIIRFISTNQPLNYFFSIVIFLNVSLAIFNLIPVPPLDGSKILLNLLSEEHSIEWQEIFNRYGIFILLILLFLPFGNSNLINILISPIINLINSFLIPSFF